MTILLETIMPTSRQEKKMSHEQTNTAKHSNTTAKNTSTENLIMPLIYAVKYQWSLHMSFKTCSIPVGNPSVTEIYILLLFN